MKVCLIHDYLNQLGGAERTLKAMHEIWPKAPIYTTLVDWGVVGEIGLPRELIRYPRCLHTPLVGSVYKFFTFLYPLVFESLNLAKFDLVVSSSANFAKGAITHPGQIHINYCHTPPRFLYHLPTETNKRQSWFWKPFLMPLDFKLRMWDWVAAQRVDHFVANSKNVARRIKKIYGRESTVIYPPVEISSKLKNENARPKDYLGESSTGKSVESDELVNLRANEPNNYYLVVSRLSAYKNVDLVIRACAQVDRPLKVVGTGPEEGSLKKLARSLKAPVEFTGFVTDDQLAEIYSACQALIFPVLEEDFGIVPLEAMSYGKPVIALRSGGVGETVVEGETGLFFKQPRMDSLVEVVLRFESLDYFETDSCAQNCRRWAKSFSKDRFKKELSELVSRVLSGELG